MDKICDLCCFDCATISTWLKCNILFVFFPQVVQKQTLGEVGN